MKLHFAERCAVTAELMTELVNWTQDYYRKSRSLDHHTLFHATANHFNLYEEEGAPIWLSRVVEGIMRDIENGED